MRDTNSNSFTHWYSLVGCCIEAFSLGHTVLGEKFVNRLRDQSTIISGENNYDKQIIAMGLLAYALLMHGKLEASMRCANKASIALTKRKEQRNGDDDKKLELSDELNDYLPEDDNLQEYFRTFDQEILTEEYLTEDQIINLVRSEEEENESDADTSDEELPLVSAKDGVNALRMFINYFEQQDDDDFNIDDLCIF